jgi:hypothetical protein
MVTHDVTAMTLREVDRRTDTHSQTKQGWDFHEISLGSESGSDQTAKV